jgi:hypothetical protein
VSLQTGTSGVVTVAGDRGHSTALLIDLARYESVSLANLSRALIHETPKRRGRPAVGATTRQILDAAVNHGVDLGLVRSALKRTPAERLALLEANRSFIQDLRKMGK